MMGLRSTWYLLLFLLPFTVGAQELSSLINGAQEAASSVEIESLQTSYDQNLGVFRAEGAVTVNYAATSISCDRAEYHQGTGDIFASGNVTIFRGGNLFRGEEAIYNINTGEITATGMSTGSNSFFMTMDEVTLPSENVDVIRSQGAYLTTHDSENPNWHLKARKIVVYPNRYVAFHGATAYAGKVPVLYLPYFMQPVNDELGYMFTPGYSDAWGAFILNQYGFMLGDHTLGKAKLDYRSERGVAGGLDLESVRFRGQPNFGKFQAYFAEDETPNVTPGGRPRDSNLDSERYRINLAHRVYLPGPEESSLYLDIDINKLSDEFFYLDFFPGEFRFDPQPDNLLNLVKYHPRGTLSLLGRFEINDFYRTDERTPEIALDLTRQPIFNSGLFLEGTTSFSVLAEDLTPSERLTFNSQLDETRSRIASINQDDPNLSQEQRISATLQRLEQQDLLATMERQIDERSYNRFDIYQQLLYPMQFWDWLNVVPRAGAGYTGYNSISATGLDGQNFDTVDSLDRPTAHAGVDLSFKLSKVYPDVHNRKWGLNEMRHILQPYSRFSWVSADDLSQSLPAIDRLAPTTKDRPLDLTRFTATDAIRDWNIVRLGMYNRIQTKRNEGTFPWLDLNTFVDFFEEDPEYSRNVSNIYNELRWSPLPWLSANIDSQLPLGDDFDFTEFNSYLMFQPMENFRFALGHFYLHDHPFFFDSKNTRLTTYTRVNDNWGFGTAHFYEAETDTLQLQQYTVHRDLSSWTAALGAQVRDNGGQDEFGVVFSMTLKAFPRVGMPTDFLNATSNGFGGAN
jgi:lipopolysaccharide assembly outer membrane protein LptD (OstA)